LIQFGDDDRLLGFQLGADGLFDLGLALLYECLHRLACCQLFLARITDYHAFIGFSLGPPVNFYY